jgi:hypothetical protein
VILMAKVKGPLYSMSASGQIGQAMVFAEWKGIPWVRKQFIPHNMKSTDQKRVRLIFSQAVLGWQTRPGVIHEDWGAAAVKTGKTLSGFNFYVAEYANSMLAGRTPSDTPPARLLP